MSRRKKRKSSKIKFNKIIVLFCILFIVIYTIAQIILSYILGLELSPTLTTAVYAFFGTELVSCATIRVFDQDSKNKSSNKNQDSTTNNSDGII